MKVKLGDVCEIINGKNQKKVENPNGKYPIYGSGGIIGYADDYICEANTVVIGRKGTINNPIFVEQSFWNVDTAFGLCANSVKLLPKFLYYFCERYDFEKLNTTVTIPSLTKTNLLNIKISLPSLDEQRHIVAVLDKVSDLIALRKKQLAKLDELVKARFVEMFGDPVSNEKNWPVKKIKNVSPIVPYKGQFDSKVWLLNLDMVEAQTGRILDYVFVDRKNVGNSTCTFDESNILYSKLRPYLNKVVLPDRNGYATSELLPLKPEKCLNKIFLANLLRGNSFVNFISEKVSGAKMPRVVMKDFNNFDCIVPPIELQQQFADFVGQVDKQKLIVKQSLEKLETLKKSLMQEYFG